MGRRDRGIRRTRGLCPDLAWGHAAPVVAPRLPLRAGQTQGICGQRGPRGLSVPARTPTHAAWLPRRYAERCTVSSDVLEDGSGGEVAERGGKGGLLFRAELRELEAAPGHEVGLPRPLPFPSDDGTPDDLGGEGARLGLRRTPGPWLPYGLDGRARQRLAGLQVPKALGRSPASSLPPMSTRQGSSIPSQGGWLPPTRADSRRSPAPQPAPGPAHGLALPMLSFTADQGGCHGHSR